MKINLNKSPRATKDAFSNGESRKVSHPKVNSIREDVKYRLYTAMFGVLVLVAIIGIIWAIISSYSFVATKLSTISLMPAATLQEPEVPLPDTSSITEYPVDAFMDVGDKVAIKQLHYHYSRYGYSDYYLVGLTKKKVLDWYEVEPDEVVYDAKDVSYIERIKDKDTKFMRHASYKLHLTDQFPIVVVDEDNN